jgi:hypothetical protein
MRAEVVISALLCFVILSAIGTHFVRSGHPIMGVGLIVAGLLLALLFPWGLLFH